MLKIYLITNRVDGKVYVGQSKHSLVARFRKHVCGAVNGYRNYLSRALLKYGIENFTIKEIDRTEHKDVSDWLEGQYIAAFKSYDHCYGYNLTMGGEGTIGWNPSKETREKISLKAIGRKC